ncbi:Uncharacterised protein [uncultured archaeon]|nr:Uncharacterised protein [uncultured archaeon]
MPVLTLQEFLGSHQMIFVLIRGFCSPELYCGCEGDLRL